MTEITNLEALKELLNTSTDILVVIDGNTSFDNLAAGLSLGLSLEKSGKKITIFSSRVPLVEDASLFGISKITNKLNSGNLIISIPEALNSVDKVTHYLDGETLNIVVHPVISGAKLLAEKITIRESDHLPSLIILVNVGWSQFLNQLSTQEQKIYPDVKRIVIAERYDVSEDDKIVSPVKLMCLAEMVVWLLTKLNLPIDRDSASNLFQGIKFATQFTPPAATASTFEAASICLAKNPVLPEIAKEETTFPKTLTRGQPPNLSGQKLESPIPPPNLLVEETSSQQSQDLPSQQNLPTLDQKLRKIHPSWMEPKIFKSGGSTKTSKIKSFS